MYGDLFGTKFNGIEACHHSDRKPTHSFFVGSNFDPDISEYFNDIGSNVF